jgi:hypothetical protein
VKKNEPLTKVFAKAELDGRKSAANLCSASVWVSSLGIVLFSCGGWATGNCQQQRRQGKVF